MKTILSLVAGAALLAAPAALAQDKKDSAGQIVTQPARDVGAQKTKIPPILVRAGDAPYSTAGMARCPAIAREIAALGRELGPDYGEYLGEAPDKTEQAAAVGGKVVVNSLIPFRSVVREISGAAPAERRLQAAVEAGLARRGFLRGLQQAKRCRR